MLLSLRPYRQPAARGVASAAEYCVGLKACRQALVSAARTAGLPVKFR